METLSKTFIAVILAFFFVSMLTLPLICSKSVEATHVQDSVQNYEQFQELYNTCKKLNKDLCNMKSLPEDDKMFEQFSKAQRVLAIETNLNRWVEEYNAKSNMWGRNLWKSDSLPKQLDVNQFTCTQ